MISPLSERDFVHATVEIDGVPEGALHVAEVTGHEAISRPYVFDVATVTTALVDPESLLGARATLFFSRGERVIRRVHGVIRSVQDGSLGPGAPSAFTLQLVPGVHHLTMRETLDVFMGLSIPGILEKKLAQLTMLPGAHYDLRLYGNHAPREFVVQYKETDLDFLARLTEHIGMSWFFEQRDDNEVLVFTDENFGFRPLPDLETIPFRGRGDRRDVYRCELTRKLIASKVVVRDYNYRNPKLDLTATAGLDGDGGFLVEYGAHVKSLEEANRIAKVRAEEQLAGRQILTGESDLPSLTPGATSLLEGHPQGDLDLLFTEVDHHLIQPALGGGGERKMVSSFRAILKSTPFRPARVTPRPRVSGVLTGVVESNGEGQYADVDDQGRYRVRFSFDTSGAGEAQASRPLRMMQPHTGAGYGMHFPLRAGAEVLIVCVDGDPDRPIIAGTVPNPTTASPVSASNARRNILRTGGANEINMDDTEDGQRIKITTPRKNTILQLGAPNDPIDGVSIKTEGHSTMQSLEGASQVAAYGMTMSTLLDLLRSPTVVNIAAFPGLLPMMGSAVGVAETIYDANRRSIESERQRVFKEESELNQEAITASQEAKRKRLDCTLCRTKAQKLMPSNPGSPPAAVTAWQAMKSAADAYDDAVNKCDDGYLSAIGTMEDRNGIIDANRSNFLNANFDPVMQRDAMAAVAAYDYDKYTDVMTKADTEEYKNLTTEQKGNLTLQDWLAERRLLWAPNTPQGDLKHVRDAAKIALDTALTTALATATDPSALRDQYLAYQAALASCVADCSTALDALRATAIEKNDEFAGRMRSNTLHLQDLQEQQNNNVKPDLTTAGTAINALLTVFATLETIVAKRAMKERWRKAANTLFDARVLGGNDLKNVINAIDARPFWKPHYTNILGSDMSAEVFGQEDAVVWSKTAMLLGMGSTARTTSGLAGMGVAGGIIGAPLPGEKPDPKTGKALVVGMEAAYLVSQGHAAVQGNRTVEILAGQRLVMHTQDVAAYGNDADKNHASLELKQGSAHLAVNNAQGQGAASLKASLVNDHGKLELKTSDGQELRLDQDTHQSELRATAAYRLLLDQPGTFSQLAGGRWTLKLHEGDANGVTLGLEDAWRLKIKHQEVDLGVHGAGPKLRITHQNSELSAAVGLRLGAADDITFATANVRFGGAQLTGEHLLVKGVVEPQLVQLRAQADAALAAANLAVQQAAPPPPPPAPAMRAEPAQARAQGVPALLRRLWPF